MCLDARVASVAVHRRRAAEDQAARTALEHGRSDVAFARIDRDGLAGNAGREERFGHAERRPRLLRSGLEHQADLHRDDGQPERVHAGRVGREDQPEHRAFGLVADRHAAFLAVASRQHVQIEIARERSEDAPHLGQHEAVLLHVAFTQVFRDAGRARLRARELVG